MKSELNNDTLENVVGGTVILSKNAMRVVFSTLREAYNLQNCTYADARDYRDELIEANPNMPNSQFDAYCRDQFRALGWIK